MKFKMNSLEKKWVLYDVANSAFTLLVATIMPIYFNFISSSAGISDVDYMAYWGYATSAATLIVAFLGPVLGTVSDFKNRKKKFFMLAVLLGAFGCVALGMIQSWLWFILLFIITKSAYSLSLVFYDAMLTDITTEDRMDQVSSNGYAWGYIGSCVPFVLCLVLVLMYDKIGLTLSTAMAIAFALIAIWWFVLTIPLFKSYEQLHYIEEQDHIIKATWSRLATVFKDLKKNRKVFMFLIAFFFYIDGVYTIIDMATAYGSALGFDSTGLLLALLLTQIVAFPAAITFGKLAAKYPNHRLILICITAYLLIALYAILDGVTPVSGWNHRPESDEKYMEQYRHPLWKDYREFGVRGNHDGMDYLVLRAFIESVQNQTEPPIDVYDAASWMAITALSEESIAQGGVPVSIPDFTHGRWCLPRKNPAREAFEL